MIKNKFTTSMYLYWMMRHNLSLAMYLLENMFYRLFDKIEEFIYVYMNKGSKGDYHMNKFKEALSKKDSLKALDIFACANRYLEKLGWSGESLDKALVYFHPASLQHFYFSYFNLKCSYHYVHIRNGETLMNAFEELEIINRQRSKQIFGEDTHNVMMSLDIRDLLILLK